MTDVATLPDVVDVTTAALTATVAMLAVAQAERDGLDERIVDADQAIEGHTIDRDRLKAALEALQPHDGDVAARIIASAGAPAAGPETTSQPRDSSAASRGAGRSGKARATTPPTVERPAPTVATKPAVVDYPAVAAVANEALAAGRPARPAVAAAFNVPGTTVNNWMQKCNVMGLLRKPTKPTKSDQEPSSNTTSKPPSPRASEPAPATVERGPRQSTPDVPATAGERPGAAPATEPPPQVTTPPQNVYACEEPGCTVTTDGTPAGRTAMRTHTVAIHGRPPSPMELTPGLAD